MSHCCNDYFFHFHIIRQVGIEYNKNNSQTFHRPLPLTFSARGFCCRHARKKKKKKKRATIKIGQRRRKRRRRGIFQPSFIAFRAAGSRQCLCRGILYEGRVLERGKSNAEITKDWLCFKQLS